jgi:hypothetical protein
MYHELRGGKENTKYKIDDLELWIRHAQMTIHYVRCLQGQFNSSQRRHCC